MNADIVGIFDMITNATRMEHAQDVKVMTSAIFFWVTFLFATFLFYDILRGSKRKVAGTSWHSVLVSASVAFYSLACFGLTRFMDGLSDQAFILTHPEAVTTLSQQTWAYEGSLLGASFAIFIFACIYAWHYFQIPAACMRKKRKSDGA